MRFPSVARVAILLRTQECPRLLSRACADIQKQSYAHWQLVVVNDGGNPARVESTLSSFRFEMGERLKVSHLPRRFGLGVAYNTGVILSSSEYLVIYEEGHAWHPDFLQETTRFMNDAGNARYGGVVCETLVSNHVYHPVLKQFCFPSISFLFKRSVAEACGLFDPALTGLSDWDFNTRFIEQAEIGVIPKMLAYY
jgi:glycosyltransferase involved in cell wall biosynthesis